MSQETVEIVRKTVEALNRGDLEAALASAHPEIEWQTLDAFPDAGTYRGHAGVQEFFGAWQDTFQGFRLHLDECVAAGGERVLAAMRVSGVGTESGVRVESPTFFQLLEYRDGLLMRARMFQTESEALEAAGQ